MSRILQGAGRLECTPPKATTCKQLADTAHYSADLTDSNVRALKAKCDAEKKAAAKAAEAKKGS